MGEGAVCLEMLADGSLGDFNSSMNELKRGHQFITAGSKQDGYPNKKHAEEASNEDIKSEISDTLPSPTENTSSFHDITSQPVTKNDQACCGDVRATSCLDSSSSEETVNHKEQSGNGASLAESSSRAGNSSDVSTSRFVLEIPKHLSSTGITKITFKFSKRKDDYLDNPGIEEPDLEMKMSTKIVLRNYPSYVKQLLSTGILDGAPVKYISTRPVRELKGIIHSGGYLCGCTACNFANVLSAYEFEHHAGAKTRNPNNHIFLENGRPIYNIIQKLKSAPPDTPLDILDDVIRNLAGSSVNEECFQVWEAGIKKSNQATMVCRKYATETSSSCHSSVSYSVQTVEEGYVPALCFPENTSFSKKPYGKDILQEPKRMVEMPSPHNSTIGVQQKKIAGGGMRKRDNDLHRLLFMSNGLPDGTELAYYLKGQRLLEGYKRGSGIVCSCCNREISPSLFEAHAGMAARRQPYHHIYISTGLSLHDIAMSLANGRIITTGDSVDKCTVCGDGGDLLLCGGCCQAFHPVCLNLQSIPESAWYCSRCKDKPVPGRKASDDEYPNDTRPLVIRLTQVVKPPEVEIGGCVFCRSHDFSVAEFDNRAVILCDQCEKEYHVGCLRDSGLCDLKELPREKWFCCDDCTRIHVALQSSVSSGAQVIPASLSDTISRKYREKGMLIGNTGDCVQWRILRGKNCHREHLPLLSRTTRVFRECFDPIAAKSGRDLIPVMVYGRNISGQGFGGMYCVALTVKSLVVSVGLLRIFGRKVAELPLAATSREYQGKGYFQALFWCIENLLHCLNVENLVLPAAAKAESIWTRKFGFTKMTEDQLQKYQREVPLTIFKGTSMLEKKVQRL